MAYTSERNNQIVIELLKQYGIKKIIISPGATNVSFVGSIQSDPFFELYSCVDERSAAYMACGMAEESGETVVLSCTGATASRNYLPGLTEAYYRKLPILAVTSSMPIERIGHNIPQIIDRTNVINDCVKYSVNIPFIKDNEDEWYCQIKANEAMLELRHRGIGPVHINLETMQSGNFDVNNIKTVYKINRYDKNDMCPTLNNKKVAILVGAHSRWSNELTNEVEKFCENYNAVVICDHTSNYKGKYRIQASLITFQKGYRANCIKTDVLIHIGNISGGYIFLQTKETWRVNPDGKLCDTFQCLRHVFEMEELEFFSLYNNISSKSKNTEYYKEWEREYDKLNYIIKELPFSNIWIAKYLSSRLPEDSILHLGILNSLRSWNFFEISNSISVYANTGGFGIDGCISSLIGAALARTGSLCFGVVGDLAFFYDMNVLGNRHLTNNVRLMVINNGHGQEFCNYGHRASQFGEKTDEYIAASGHYGNKSGTLIKGFAESLGMKYLSAKSKEEFLDNVQEYICLDKMDCPIIFEIFTDPIDEANALDEICHLIVKSENSILNGKRMIRKLIGDKGVENIKQLFDKH